MMLSLIVRIRLHVLNDAFSGGGRGCQKVRLIESPVSERLVELGDSTLK